MIELPEATVIAQQMNAELTGKQIEAGSRGNATHKFAFSSGSEEEYETILQDKRVGPAKGHGGAILAPLEPGYMLVLGGGGERILYHPGDSKLLVSSRQDQNFIDAVLSRGPTVSPIEDSVRSDIISLLCDIAVRTGRKITWDPKQESIVGDPEAAKMMHRPMRAPWTI